MAGDQLVSHTRTRALARANRAATVALVVVLAVLALGLGLRVAGVTPLVERSGSMAPALGVGDVLLVRDVPVGALTAGEIVSLEDPLGGRVITHRVASVGHAGGRVVVVTRGDANAASERWVLRADATVQRLAARVPAVGRPLLWLSSGWLPLALAALGAAFLLAALLLRPTPLAAGGACLLVLVGAGGTVLGTSSSFTASVTNAGNTFAAAAANAAPDVTATVIGKSAGGSVGAVRRGGTFHVYANATDDSGVSSVRATLTNVTGSSTAVSLTAGSYRAGGVSYGWRSAQLTASSSLSNGAKSFTVTATDAAGLTDSLTGSVTADSTAPSARSIATTNKTGGTAGRAEQGDTAVITFSEAIDPDSLFDGWDGAATDVQVAIIDGGRSNDVLRVYDEDALDTDEYLPLGTIDLGRTDFVTSGSYAVFGLASASGGTSSRMVLSGATLTITLGSLDLGTSSTSGGNATERYTPVNTITDLAGNASGTSTISASGSHRAF